MKFAAPPFAAVLALSLPLVAFAQTATVPPPSNAIVPGQVVATTPDTTSSSQPSPADELGQIQTLQQELAQLQQQLGGSSAAPSGGSVSISCSAIVPVLSV